MRTVEYEIVPYDEVIMGIPSSIWTLYSSRYGAEYRDEWWMPIVLYTRRRDYCVYPYSRSEYNSRFLGSFSAGKWGDPGFNPIICPSLYL